MKYWWVNHGKNYKGEILDGYIRAPEKGKIFWENVGKVKKGDYIFSYAEKYIRDIGVATSDPKLIKSADGSNDFYVKVSWTTFSVPFKTLSIWNKTKYLFSKCQNAPLTENGKGCQGYLYEITKELFVAYCKYIKGSCRTDISKFLSDDNEIWTNTDEEIIVDNENLEKTYINDFDENELDELDDNVTEESNFTYERDLQDSLVRQINKLFPEYSLFRDGVEYFIDGKRIDVLLENKSKNELLVIELKAGLAKKEVLSQLLEYMGKLEKKFSEKAINGLIISGEIDESLKDACIPVKNIKTMRYKIDLLLIEE